MKILSEMTTLQEAAGDQERKEKALQGEIDRLKKEVTCFRESQNKVWSSGENITFVDSKVKVPIISKTRFLY